MSSVDIKAAYRSIMINPKQWKYQGLSWVINNEHKYMVDTHICFGSQCAPYIFTEITNFILRCLKRRGYVNSIVYLDDFLVTGNSREECAEAQKALITLLRSLGLYLAWPKCVAPCQKIAYLGVLFDTTTMTISLPADKLDKLHQELFFFWIRTKLLRNNFSVYAE